MISPTKTESFSLMSGWKAFKTWSTMITSEATTTSCTMMRIRSGTRLRSNEMMTLPPIITKSTERLMMTACWSCTVIASAEQMPNTCTVMGLLSSRGSLRSLRFFLLNKLSRLVSTAVLVSVLIVARVVRC